ncbi:hypothetical protein B0H14DRAFT_2653509 [Mycena olivaceomarginata]|nr:hypothetical protein B0H14DRAFT_2653509 [Mycena olivaceomarginata]
MTPAETECGRPKGAARSSTCIWAFTTTTADAAGVSRAFVEVSDHVPAAVTVEPEPDVVRLPWAEEEGMRKAPMPEEGLRMVTAGTGGAAGRAATGNGCVDLEQQYLLPASQVEWRASRSRVSRRHQLWGISSRPRSMTKEVAHQFLARAMPGSNTEGAQGQMAERWWEKGKTRWDQNKPPLTRHGLASVFQSIGRSELMARITYSLWPVFLSPEHGTAAPVEQRSYSMADKCPTFLTNPWTVQHGCKFAEVIWTPPGICTIVKTFAQLNA